MAYKYEYKKSPNYTQGRRSPITTVVIQLTQGKEAIVDQEDYEYLSQFKWNYTHGYARRIEWLGDGKQRPVYMHRVITGAKEDELVDHINQDKLDNRKQNLRPSNKSENAFNSKIRTDNTSGYRGVTKHKKKWVAQCNFMGKHYYIGIFTTEKEAAKAYNNYLGELNGLHI